MRRTRLVALVLLFAFALPPAARSAPTHGPKRGSLVIVGGGKLGPEITSKLVALAGGPNTYFVVIPTAGEDRQLSDLEKIKQDFIKTFSPANAPIDPAHVAV